MRVPAAINLHCQHWLFTVTSNAVGLLFVYVFRGQLSNKMISDADNGHGDSS